MQQKQDIKGFTILELLVVITIVAVVSAVGYPNFMDWRKDREIRGSMEKVSSMLRSINTQAQRGNYAVVQFMVKPSGTSTEFFSKGMSKSTESTIANSSGQNVTCQIVNSGYWTNHQVEYSKYDVSTNINNNGAVCFSKDTRYFLKEGKLSKQLKSNVFFTGQEEDQNEAKEFLIKAFFIAVFLITIILIATFNSFYFCLIILSAIIFSTIGVMIGLIISGKPFGIIMSGIGVIALAGIVVNNNIVLLDTYKTLRMGGEKIKDAILRTGAQRLRPVMLTTLTTFFGLVPMAIGLNINFLDFEINFGSPSSQWWLQLSNAIVFGVMFSFILTLIITPCLILIGEKSKIFKTF